MKGGLAALEASASHIDDITATGATLSVTASVFAATRPCSQRSPEAWTSPTLRPTSRTGLAALEKGQSAIDLVTTTGGMVNVDLTQFDADRALLAKIHGGYEITGGGAGETFDLRRDLARRR